ncbi:hypothetical protein Micbo1qcDRAFT_166610 [Microdochium bolleyi]|uniref:Uncharacterized protein n=1 Tax=Microdochium bolleyi TaxID=196109 RepID=A0A136IUG5_9PEZI|nr:hypothetical protein Micbo1qcDRAFT_166610 [Microdochium bolleyi]
MSEPLSKVDSAVDGLEPLQKIGSASGPKKDRRQSSIVAGVASIKELWENKTPLKIAPETQKTGWKINTSSMTVEEKDILKKPLVTPVVRAIDLHFALGSHVTARNRTGVTIKDAMDAIHKVNKKRADDEMDKPYLEGFEWMPSHHEYSEQEQEQKEADWQRLYVHLTSTPTLPAIGGGKKKKNKGGE